MRRPLLVVVLAALALGLVLAPGAQSAPRAAPDLTLAWWADPPGRLDPGVQFTVAALVRNAGTRSAPATRTRFYLTRDSRRAPGGSDVLLASVATPRLRAGGERLASAYVALPADTASGTYSVLTCVDATRRVRERREGDSCRASASTLFVTDAPPAATGGPAGP